MAFVHFHVRAMSMVLISVLAGLLVAPGAAFIGTDGRLAGIVWPLWPTEVGEFSAVAGGLVLLMWLTGELSGRVTVLLAVPEAAFLLLSHTRTALLGLALGLAVAGVSLLRSNPRARRTLLVTASVAGLVGLTAYQPISNWLERGQDSRELANLTGRQQIWDILLAKDRTLSDRLLGVGLGDKGYHGPTSVGAQFRDGTHPIDSSWLAAYQELGYIGVALIAAILVVLFAIALTRRAPPGRACALFLVVYCAVASYTESGLSDASFYLLHLAVAASLLIARGQPENPITNPPVEQKRLSAP
jgi:O-antigen ligase